MVAKYEAEKLKYQKLMDKVPEEVKKFEQILKSCYNFLLQVKEKAKAEKRQKKAIATGRNAAAELKVGVGFKSRFIAPQNDSGGVLVFECKWVTMERERNGLLWCVYDGLLWQDGIW